MSSNCISIFTLYTLPVVNSAYTVHFRLKYATKGAKFFAHIVYDKYPDCKKNINHIKKFSCPSIQLVSL